MPLRFREDDNQMIGTCEFCDEMRIMLLHKKKLGSIKSMERITRENQTPNLHRSFIFDVIPRMDVSRLVMI